MHHLFKFNNHQVLLDHFKTKASIGVILCRHTNFQILLMKILILLLSQSRLSSQVGYYMTYSSLHFLLQKTLRNLKTLGFTQLKLNFLMANPAGITHLV